MSSAPARPSRAPGFRAALMMLMYLAVSTGMTGALLELPGSHDSSALGYYTLSDFKVAIYYPVRSFLDGHKPYDPVHFKSSYPVFDEAFPLYAPYTLLLHGPFGLLSPDAAAWCHYGLNLLLLVVLAWLVLRVCDIQTTAARVFGLATLLLLSRPGAANQRLGQSTVYIIVGLLVALNYARDRPVIAGLGFALASLKPSWGAPLALCMICRRDYRAFVIGLAVAASASLLAVALLAPSAGGIGRLLESFIATHRAFAGQSENASSTSPFRVDAASLVARVVGSPLGAVGDLAIAAVVLGLALVALHALARRPDPSARQLACIITGLAALCALYHQTYDLLVLALPATALAAGAPPTGLRIAAKLRVVVLALVLFPAWNYVASNTLLDRLGLGTGWSIALLSVNAAAVLLALLIYVALALGPPPRETAKPVRVSS